MSEMTSDDPWFIARDGQQHGPLTDSEMKLFVERGHLRPTDLIWRQGFPDWRPAQAVFPAKPQPTPTAPPAGPVPQPQSATRGTAGTGMVSGGQLGHGGFSQAGPTAGGNSATDSTEQSGFGVQEKQPPRWGRAIAATIFVGALAGMGLWFYVNGATNPFYLAAATDDQLPVVKAPETADATLRAPKPTPPEKPVIIDIDQRLQKAELWQFLKATYPRWYASVLENAEQIPTGDEFDRKFSELLVTRLIELRRRNAEKVLASSSESLTTVASSFLDNLKHLATRGAEPCYTFISKGEASPAVIDVMRKPETAAPIHSQLLATFKASVEGEKSPVTREAPQKADYQALTSQLAKIGWNKEDIQLFANPKALSQAPPDRVCQMVQDWFTAHLNLENAEAKERLLFETLRPVVSG